MKYLLDVNALIALGFVDHQFHSRVTAWIHAENHPGLLTCSTTELGFVRVLAYASSDRYTVPQARDLLLRLKKSSRLSLAFVSDNNDISALPAWVLNPKQTMDGHLLGLAKAHAAVLATFDAKIPGAFRIP